MTTPTPFSVPLHRLSLPAIAAVVLVTVCALLAAVVAVLAGSLAEVAQRLTLAGLTAAATVAHHDQHPPAGQRPGLFQWRPSTGRGAGSGGAW